MPLNKETKPNLISSGINTDKNDTAIFINKVLIFWKIQIDRRHNDALQVEIRSPKDCRLDFIIEFGQMVLNMTSSESRHIKQLSKHIATTLHHTCNSIVSLCR